MYTPSYVLFSAHPPDNPPDGTEKERGCAVLCTVESGGPIGYSALHFSFSSLSTQRLHRG